MTEEQTITLMRFIGMRSVLDKFEDEATKLMLASYTAATKELLNDVQEFASGSLAKARAEALLDETLGTIDVINKKMVDDIAGMSGEAGVYSYKQTNDILSWDGKVKDFVPVALSAAQINSLVKETPLGGVLLEDWVSRTFSDKIKAGIQEEITTGYIKGEGYKKLVARVTKQFEVSKRDATTLARTYVQTVNVNASKDIIEANKDIVPEVEWSAIMESSSVKSGRGTCIRCQSLDGQTWPQGSSSIPPIPLHARCRCMLIPVVLSWNELFKGLGYEDIKIDELRKEYRPWNIRADLSRNVGGVPILDYGVADKSYEDWWGGQSKAFQNNSVGPRRAELVRNGDIDFEDLAVYNEGYMRTLNRKSKKAYKLGDQVLLDDLYQFGGVTPPTAKKPPSKPSAAKKKLPAAKKPGAIPSLKEVGEVMDKQDHVKKINKKLIAIEKGLEKQRKKYFNSSISERTGLYNSITDLNKQKKLLQSQITIKNMPEVEDVLKPPKGGKIDWQIGSVGKTAINKNRKEWEGIIKDAEDMYHPNVLEKLSSILLSRRKNSRARYTSRDKGILMGNEDTGVFIHEFSHHLEHDANLYDKAKAFLSSRTVGESPSQIYRGEYGWKDKFFSHYCGKDYRHNATEILSMGVQKMYENPYDFYDTDKEYFEFILKVMWGE